MTVDTIMPPPDPLHTTLTPTTIKAGSLLEYLRFNISCSVGACSPARPLETGPTAERHLGASRPCRLLAALAARGLAAREVIEVHVHLAAVLDLWLGLGLGLGIGLGLGLGLGLALQGLGLGLGLGAGPDRGGGVAAEPTADGIGYDAEALAELVDEAEGELALEV